MDFLLLEATPLVHLNSGKTIGSSRFRGYTAGGEEYLVIENF